MGTLSTTIPGAIHYSYNEFQQMIESKIKNFKHRIFKDEAIDTNSVEVIDILAALDLIISNPKTSDTDIKNTDVEAFLKGTIILKR